METNQTPTGEPQGQPPTQSPRETTPEIAHQDWPKTAATPPATDPSDMSHLDKMLDEQSKELNELMDDLPAADVGDVTDERATELHERTMAAVGAISTEDERTRAWRAFLVADDMSVWSELNIRLTSARVAAETVVSAGEVRVDRDEATTAARTAFDDITCLVEIAEHDTALETAVLEEQLYLSQRGSNDAIDGEESAQ